MTTNAQLLQAVVRAAGLAPRNVVLPEDRRSSTASSSLKVRWSSPRSGSRSRVRVRIRSSLQSLSNTRSRPNTPSANEVNTNNSKPAAPNVAP